MTRLSSLNTPLPQGNIDKRSYFETHRSESKRFRFKGTYFTIGERNIDILVSTGHSTPFDLCCVDFAFGVKLLIQPTDQKSY